MQLSKSRARISLFVIVSACFVVIALLGGLYAVLIGSLESQKLALVLFILPVFFGILALKDAATVLFFFLVLSLSFSARFRLFGYSFYPGAELALAPMDFPLILLALMGLSQGLKRPVPVPSSMRRLFWPFLFLFSVHLASVIPAPNRNYALLEALRLLKMALFVWVVAHYLDSRKKIMFVVNLILLSVVLQGVLAIVQSVFHISLGLGFMGEHQFWTISKEGTAIGRAGGTLGHSNVLANFFEVLVPIGLAVILSGAKGRLRLLAYGAVFFGGIGTVLTASRAGWGALTIGLVLVIFQFRKRIAKTRIILAVFVIVLALGSIGLVFQDIIVARLTIFLEGSSLVRELSARTALKMLRANPVIGVGANNYTLVSDAYAEAASPGLRQLARGIVHNIFLLYGAELGLVGLLAFLVMLLSVLRLAQRIILSSNLTLTALSVGIWAGIIALLAHGMWDWLFRYDPVYTLFWFCVGLLVALENVINKNKAQLE